MKFVAVAGFALTLMLRANDAPPSPAIEYTSNGELKFPANYREWIFLSSGVGMTYQPAGAGMPEHPDVDNVFVNPEAYRYFLEKGSWPDKTSLVLEIRHSESKGSINQGGFYQGETEAVEVHVKDKRLGGGWGFFGFGEKQATGKPFPKSASCFSCHEQHGAVDTTFVQFYPTLRSVAKAKATFHGER